MGITRSNGIKLREKAIGLLQWFTPYRIKTILGLIEKKTITKNTPTHITNSLFTLFFFIIRINGCG